ncbi:S24 family peptidase [Pseudomonas sp. CR3202]|uniref:S24 family peptidase n=1 Tax=Pseudomonas sp. CR3202 TaxID=3351532 RepID=UPI003BF453C9
MKTTDRITKLVLARKPNLGARNVKRDIADTCKVSYEAVRRWYVGDTENIRNENLIALAEGYDTTVDWLLSGKGEPPRRNGNPHETVFPVDLLISPYDLNTEGHGQAPVDYSQFVRTITVSEQQLEKLGIDYSSPANLSVITAWGQSMERTINDKDLVLLDRGISKYAGDGVYLVTWAGHLFIKRLQLAGTNQLELISDNPTHKTRVVAMDEVNVHAKAVLIWSANKP